MLLECMEEGVVKWTSEIEAIDSKQWINVGTVLGEIVDDDDDDEGDDLKEEEWTWQAYLHDNDGSTDENSS